MLVSLANKDKCGLLCTYISLMKTIFIDAINTFVSKDRDIFQEMHDLLEQYPR